MDHPLGQLYPAAAAATDPRDASRDTPSLLARYPPPTAPAPSLPETRYDVTGLSVAQCHYLAQLCRYGRSREAIQQAGICHTTVVIWRRRAQFLAAERAALKTTDWPREAAIALARRYAPAVMLDVGEAALMTPQTDRDRTVKQRAAETVLRAAQVLDAPGLAQGPGPVPLHDLARRLWARRTTVTEELSALAPAPAGADHLGGTLPSEQAGDGSGGASVTDGP